MGLTYTNAAHRDRLGVRSAGITTGEQLLALVSAVVLLAVGLGYAGRLQADARATSNAVTPVNVNAVTHPSELEPALAKVLAYPAERRAAAVAIAARAAEPVPNVGALARLEIDGRRLLTPAQLAALKPYLSVRTHDDFRRAVAWCTAALLIGFHLVSLVWRWRGLPGDRVLLALAHLVVGIGFVMMMTRPDPLRDTLLLVRYTQGVVVGLALFGAASMIDVDRAAFRELTYLPLLGALVLSVVLIAFGSGPGASNARVNLGPVQPIEAIRLLLALFLAGYFARRWELIRQVARMHHVLPVAGGVAAALALFFLQKDLGPALLLSLLFLALFAVARGGARLACGGLAGLVAGFAIGYVLNISTTLAARLAMWQSPWDNAVRGGDQVAQALWGLAAGAVAGTGLGLGSTRFVPEGHTDLVLATVGEELGFIGLVVLAVAFAAIAWRGFAIARRASSDYRFFLALAVTLSLAIPVIVMSAGMLGALPLTGVVTPFLSFGGSAMAANFTALGLLASIGRDRRPTAGREHRRSIDLTPFHGGLRWSGRVAAACAVILLVIAARVQALGADEYLVRPQLGLQADGGRRYQYNPRVLDALRDVPRGTIYDATGLPLATSSPAIAKQAAGDYAGLGRSVSDACPNPADRCYPAGPSFFHLLGDLNTHANWGAANSSYLERDAEELLRGFDDRATTVQTTDREGRPAIAVRRDYSPVVALVRRRWQPDHPDVQAFLSRERDVRVTVDARLQLAAASILERAALATRSQRGAVVAIDAATGAVLASVSYPWPAAAPGAASAAAPAEAWLDRARYGLYPPGSTFKMITAAAALRESSTFADRPFLCHRLPSGRFGIRIPGFGPPIHDDDRDLQAHGNIAMRDAIARSCNAYFAQLAVAVGVEALSRTAATAGIELNTSASAERVLANLPHAGYGQGEVVATPLRLARVAAAIGTDGTLREAPLVTGSPTVATPFLTAADARTLAGALRQAVLAGTGKLLRTHPARVAGKTGTAEIDEAGSHAWFVGFAPYGPAARRIAFAVVLEHAGYGGAAAANVAGQLASAASSLGLVK